MSDQKTIKVPHQFRISEQQRPQRRFTPAARDPWHLPDEKFELPGPAQLPPAPPALNLITTILPPVILIGGTLIFSLITGTINWLLIGPMLIMSLGFPLANLIGLMTQKKAYQKALEARKYAYREKLEEAHASIQQLIKTQINILQTVYPPAKEVIRTALTQGKPMWSRRQSDDDFLAARFGEKVGAPSFSIELPRYFDPNDALLSLPQQLAASCTQVRGIPALLEFSRIGSLVLTGKVSAGVHALARRMILDLIVHHSPKDLQLAVLADSNEAVNRWEWLKWVPHLEAFEQTAKVQRLAFDPPKIHKFIEWLHGEYQNRRGRLDGYAKVVEQQAILVILDDTGEARQNPDIALIADLGVTVGIYLLFIGGRTWPHECRARIELLDDKHFRLLETWSRDSRPVEGLFETVPVEESQRVARAIAGLQLGGAQSNAPLPASIRISEVLGAENLTLAAIKAKWQLDIPPKEQLQFPIGLRSRRDHLDLAVLNLLPDKADGHDVGGYDAYHTILIGTTGSGKSEFMKSLVMGAALRYPPSLLNFFFLDFKGGAAFSVFEHLPHVSGIVTNLSPELVERGLDSIRNEIARRQEEFADAHVRDIWGYNSRHSSQLMPHMILFLDEFARGLADFPRLRETLDVLVRQGRSLGMYLVLANQDVSSEVDKLLNNVGWRIALKVAKPEEMTAMIGRGRTIATRTGQGYLKRGDEDAIEFQAGYAGLPVRTENAALEDEFTIYQVDADGAFHKFYTRSNAPSPAVAASPENQSSQKEEELIVDLLRHATEDLEIKPASKIYLEPLPAVIDLEQVLEESGIQQRFADGSWREEGGRQRLIAPIGEADMPRECRQEQLTLDFEDQDGHLWIVGAAGSGKERVLSSLLLTLAQIHSPAELQFYMLELGAGDLKQFEALPHTGAVIRPQIGEKERFKRLLDFLENEMDQRTAGYDYSENQPQNPNPFIFLVINNFAELRASFPDEAERLARFVRDGKRAGIHMILITNRGPELAPSLRNNIARRLVLQLGSKDEHLELVGRELLPIAKIDGRGYWVDGAPCECQIAFPNKPLRDVIRAMDEAWKGSRPRRIDVLATCIPYAQFADKFILAQSRKHAMLPVGQSYETLDGILIDLESDAFTTQTWLVMGAKESGKSNFLGSAARGVLDSSEPGYWDIRAYTPRRSPLINLGKEGAPIQVFSDSESIIDDLNKLTAEIQAGERKRRTLLLVDDLGAAFQPGRERLAAALNQLAPQMEHAEAVTLMAAGMLDELRMQIGAPIVKLLKQSRMGMVFSKDSGDMDWLSAQLQLEQRKAELHPGRGFFISRGKPQLVQTPFLGTCPRK